MPQPGDLAINPCNLQLFVGMPTGKWPIPQLSEIPTGSCGIVLEQRDRWIRWMIAGKIGWSNVDFVQVVNQYVQDW